MDWSKLIRLTIYQAVATFIIATLLTALWDKGNIDWPAQFRTGTAILFGFLIFNWFDARKSQKDSTN